MSLVVENESALSLTVTERDPIAVGAEEGTLPSLESCAVVHAKQRSFCQALGWGGAGGDSERVVESPRVDQAIVVVIHRVPRYAACAASELTSEWESVTPFM